MKTYSLHKLICSIALLALVLSAFPMTSVSAEPDAPSAIATFFVDSIADNTTADTKLTLREAIMLANGGTGPFGLNRGLTWEEFINHVFGGGCNISGNTGELFYCGAGYADTISFSNTLGSHPVFVLKTPLNGLVDSQPTTIDGINGNVYPIIDASQLGANSDGLIIGAPGSIIKGITISGAPRWDFNVYASNIQLIGVSAWRAGQAGISLRGNGAIVNQALIGLESANSSNCGSGAANKGNHQEGVLINTGAKNNVVKNSVIGCNGSGGIGLAGSGTNYNTIGPGNAIGTNATGTIDLANVGSDGIYVSTGANYNTIVTNTIAFNDANGISLIDVHHINVGGNTIRKNFLDGVYITGISQANVIGGPSFGAPTTGNLISGNYRHGVEIAGAGVQNITLAGNKIGVNTDASAADGNAYSGVMIDGAHNNIIGDTFLAPNIIGGNLQNGVALVDGANANSIAHNLIGTNQTNAAKPLPNLFNGVLLDSGAHDNTLGTANTIAFSGLHGIAIQGNNTAHNLVKGNFILSGSGNGVLIRDGAHDNTIGSLDDLAPNAIDSNLGQGVLLASGAANNKILSNDVTSSGKNGIELDGLGTTNNMISGTLILGSQLDGINERNGASSNWWSHLQMERGRGMPIDKEAPDDIQNISNEPHPTIETVSNNAGTLTIEGSATASSFLSSNTVEVYGVGRGIAYLASASVDDKGHWTVNLPSSVSLSYTSFIAFQTFYSPLFGAGYTSSEFGELETHTVFLPLVIR